jgi:activated CDC42 kinase 1
MPQKQRLDVPDSCPIDYYNLMLKCWAHEPSERPAFAQIINILTEVLINI